MSFTRAKPAGWSSGDTFTAAQANAIDVDHANALDKTSAGDTISGILTLSTAGRILPSVVIGADANTTYTVGTSTEIRVTSAVTADREYTLSATGVSTNDVITIWVDSSATNKITVKDQAAATLITLGLTSESESQWAEFIYIGGWRVHTAAKAATFQQAFTANGTWTCPRGVTLATVYLCGGGGGGAGGRGGSHDANGYERGGGGGSAAPIVVTTRAVTPGTGYAIVVGTGGPGGAAGVGGIQGVSSETSGGVGSDGVSSSFDVTLVGYGGFGGGTMSNALADGDVAFGGAYATEPLAVSGGPQRGIAQGCGGNGGSVSALSPARAGGRQGAFAGGAAGSAGTTTGSMRGGGAGGGGGAGMFGAGGAGGTGGNGHATDGLDGTAGTAGAANTGAGGGGGGAGGGGDDTGGEGAAGGAGGSGKVIVVWTM